MTVYVSEGSYEDQKRATHAKCLVECLARYCYETPPDPQLVIVLQEFVSHREGNVWRADTKFEREKRDSLYL